MTVWYKPSSSWSTAMVSYQANGKWSGEAKQMTMACDGWYKYVILDTHGEQVRITPVFLRRFGCEFR